MKWIALLVLAGCQGLKVGGVSPREPATTITTSTVGEPLEGNPPSIPWWLVAIGGCGLLWKLTQED